MGGRWAAPALPAGGVLRGGPGWRVCAQPALLEFLVFWLVGWLVEVLLVNFAVMGVPVRCVPKSSQGTLVCCAERAGTRCLHTAHRITESSRLEETSTITKSNL